ncbi:MAG: preprotein translocase subunit YajC [Alkalispirochaeta sp.]
MNMIFDLPLLVGAPESAAGAGGPASVAPTLVTFGLVFAIFYFLIIRPQNKRQKETKQMLQNLKKGDRVTTIGGIRGTIFSMKDDVVVLKVDDNTKIQFSKSAVNSVVDKKAGTKEAAAKDTSETSEDAEESDEAESK